MTRLSVDAPPPRRSPAAHTSREMSLLALQRSAGNASSVALMRRGRGLLDEAPVTFTLPGVVDGASVSSWSFDRGGRGVQAIGVNLTRPTDVNSPRLYQALTNGGPGGTATLVVRKLTALGWVRQTALTMADCMVSSYQQDGDSESIGLTFSRVRVEQ